jgi:hypothetical protein
VLADVTLWWYHAYVECGNKCFVCREEFDWRLLTAEVTRMSYCFVEWHHALNPDRVDYKSRGWQDRLVGQQIGHDWEKFQVELYNCVPVHGYRTPRPGQRIYCHSRAHATFVPGSLTGMIAKNARGTRAHCP